MSSRAGICFGVSASFGAEVGDAIGGFAAGRVTLAAYLVPAGLGDASLANLPPQAGLYACLFSGLCFWLFCSSRHTVITITSAISLLIGASLGGLASLIAEGEADLYPRFGPGKAAPALPTLK